MIVEVACTVAALMLGAVAARRDKRPRCAAFGDIDEHGNWNNRDAHCRELADPVCDVGYCRVHCKDGKRCAGECIAQRRRLLEEAHG